jgi:hypothetical protein
MIISHETNQNSKASKQKISESSNLPICLKIKWCFFLPKKNLLLLRIGLKRVSQYRSTNPTSLCFEGMSQQPREKINSH